ncbi:hypothetical protein C5610_04585 [Idiomarina sp. OT37-5b]|uniref:Uncharacterized protein n=1 Tax=Idiomarina aquatica TaxID=1327752 RepID=A0AA94JDH1_9GAMM|nr:MULTISPECIES: hypothetical protein [Idiomarina]AVJ55649.1 hypothetical protein C5610_04585 [Idiomarina sp. OT37-5b]RUO44734.1 hypothetical protein CWE23_01480 [Idiomarina aquatica]
MQMRYRGIIKMVPVCAIWLAIAVLALALIETPAEPVSVVINSLICVAVVALAFRLSAEIFFKVIRLNKQRIEYTQAWGKPRSYRWQDVEAVNFVGWWQAFELVFRDGKRVKVSLMMDNLRSFLQLLSEQLPRDKYQHAIEQFAGTFGGKNNDDKD